MKKIYKFYALTLILSLLLGILSTGNITANAASIYSQMTLNISRNKLTIYTNIPEDFIYPSIGHFYSGSNKYSQSAIDSAREKIQNDLVYTTSNPSVVCFCTYTYHHANGEDTYETTDKITSGKSVGNLLGLSEGSATITIKSSILNKTLKIKITVKDAELFCTDSAYYENNTYNFTMKGKVAATSYTSSNEAVACVNASTGAVTTKKPGTATISCLADNGKTYKQKIKIQKCGLSYTKLTTYYYTGFKKGCYTYFPLVAKGIHVKSWKSSNKKICKVIKYGRLGKLQMLGTGKCTITCTSKEGKKYKCKLTVVGGKKWGGLNGGYQPTLSTIKKHGYFKDINTVKDYGDVIVIIKEYDHQIKLGNGNKKLPDDIERLAMNEHYDDGKTYTYFSGDYLCFKSNDGKKYGRIWCTCYYVE